MEFFTYLTTPAPFFGPLAWTFFIGQLLAVGAGAYLYLMHQERNPARHTFMRQLAVALLILGGVGVLLGTLRLLNLPTLNQRLWLWVQLVVELGVGAYVVYYYLRVLPDLERASAGRARSSPRSVTAGAVPVPPRPVPNTGRREARRDRKRKAR